MLRPFLLRRLKRDVEKDLPCKQERVVKYNFAALQTKLNKQLMMHNRIMFSDGKGSKTGKRGLSNLLVQLRKLCNHPFVFEEVEDQMNLNRLTNGMSGAPRMTAIMNIMEDFMQCRGYKYLRLDGSTQADDRQELLKDFNAPDLPYFCFLLLTRAGGLGVHLQSADTVIIYDLDWSPQQVLQAQDRAPRMGQKNEVRVLRLIASNSVEEKILERAQSKLDMDGKSTAEERDEVLRAMLESAEAAEAAMEHDGTDDDDLNVIMARKDGELELFGKMDQERMENQQYSPRKTLARLLGERELPDIYMNDGGRAGVQLRPWSWRAQGREI
ncbi:transcriptional regulator [Elasticomyces elasticus]|nr:transcriptional regulator [Elasticomyces elasticus]